MIRLELSSKARSVSVKSAKLLKLREILGVRELEPRIEIEMEMGMKKGNREERRDSKWVDIEKRDSPESDGK